MVSILLLSFFQWAFVTMFLENQKTNYDKRKVS